MKILHRAAAWIMIGWFIALTMQQIPRVTAVDTSDSGSDFDDNQDDGLIVSNPDYVEPEEESESSGSDVEEQTAELGGTSSKSVLSHALRSPRKASKFLKKHRLTIAALVMLVVFRNELWRATSTPVLDPATGQVVGRSFTIRLSSLVKIAVFLYLYSLFYDSGEVSASTTLLLGRLTGQSSLALILSSLLGRNSNTAYLPPVNQHFTFETLNKRYSKDSMALSKALAESRISDTAALREALRTNSTRVSLMDLIKTPYVSMSELSVSGASKKNGTVIVMDWTALDTSITNMESLRDEVSFLIREHHKRKDNFEILLLLQSPGGSAADYSLAAQQILRLRNEGIRVTICVDKVAASGGYMIACTSSPGCLYAAPFAVVGSIGVVGQTVNIHKVLEGWGVRSMVFRGGRHKAPLGLIGEVTKEAIENVQGMIDSTHRAFKRHVSDCRPVVAEQIENIATGDTWIGFDALELGLVDRIITSDEYIEQSVRKGAIVLKLHSVVRRSIFGRPSAATRTRASKGLVSTLLDCKALLSKLADSLLVNDDRFDLLSRTAGAQATSETSSVSASKVDYY